MRTEKEVREQLDKFKKQAREYSNAKQGPEALLCYTIVNVLSYVLGETNGPTVRAKLD